MKIMSSCHFTEYVKEQEYRHSPFSALFGVTTLKALPISRPKQKPRGGEDELVLDTPSSWPLILSGGGEGRVIGLIADWHNSWSVSLVLQSLYRFKIFRIFSNLNHFDFFVYTISAKPFADFQHMFYLFNFSDWKYIDETNLMLGEHVTVFVIFQFYTFSVNVYIASNILYISETFCRFSIYIFFLFSVLKHFNLFLNGKKFIIRRKCYRYFSIPVLYLFVP